MCKNTTDQLSLVMFEVVIGDAVVEIVFDMVHIHACIDDRSSMACDTTIVVYISTGKLSFNPSIYIHL